MAITVFTLQHHSLYNTKGEFYSNFFKNVSKRCLNTNTVPVLEQGCHKAEQLQQKFTPHLTECTNATPRRHFFYLQLSSPTFIFIIQLCYIK